jgi:hypothetical protein
MSTGMILAIVFLLFILGLALSNGRNQAMCFNEEESTTTTTSQGSRVAGGLRRQLAGSQFYVIDPVDQQKIWLNSNDDMYEDADGKVWRLV